MEHGSHCFCNGSMQYKLFWSWKGHLQEELEDTAVADRSGVIRLIYKIRSPPGLFFQCKNPPTFVRSL